MNAKTILIRYGTATVGLFLVSLGISFSIISNLGTAPLSCAAYVLNLKFTGITVGTFNVLVNMSYMLIQLLVLRRNFRAEMLLQVVASVLLGVFVDFGNWAFAWMASDAFLPKLLLTLLAAVVTAVGVSIEVKSGGWMLSAEMTVNAFSTTFSKNFGSVKVVMDSLMLVIAAVLALIFFGNPFGKEYTNFTDVLFARSSGVVISMGTLLLAFLPGWLMRITQKPVDRLLERIFPVLK